MKWLLILLITAGSLTSDAQRFDLKDLANFATFPVSKFDDFMRKKDFRRDYYAPRETASEYNYFQDKKTKRDTIFRTFAIKESNGKTAVTFQTTSEQEWSDIRTDLREEGYRYFADVDSEGILYQKGEVSVRTSMEIRDSLQLFTFYVERKELPKVKDIVYAEDLLNADSHEYLRTLFGENNIRQDLFHFSEKEVNKCTVLFPNTNREVLFVWDDEENYRKVSFLVIGNNWLTDGSRRYDNQIEHNAWQSKQGLWSGMTLKELQDVNGGEIRFYNWNAEQAGMLAPKNTGQIDFNKIGLVMNCLNCNDNNNVRLAGNNNIMQSGDALAADRKIYVTTLIILPEKEESTTVSRTP